MRKPKANREPPEVSVRISALLWADILVGYALFVMQDYLTSVWNLNFTHAAGILNVWGGITMVLPAIFLFLVDALLGNFTMLLVSSVSYSVGIGLVTMSTPPVLGGSCKRYEEECIGQKQKALFYAGMALIAVGVAGNQVSLKPFLEEQKGKKQSNCCMILLSYSAVVAVALTGAIGLPYVKPWKLRFGIPAICTTAAMVIFLGGFFVKPYYKMADRKSKESPITKVFRVLFAFWFKLCKSFPDDYNQRYRTSSNRDERPKHTRCLRCLEKASIVMIGEVDEQGKARNRWKLCSVEEVEEAKTAVRMIPMWLTFVVCGIISSIGNTYFVEQANNLDRHIGKWNVPLQIFMLASTFSKYVFGLVSNCILDYKKKGHAPSVGIGFAMVLSVLCCVTSARIEKKRLGVVRRNGLLDKPDEDIPMSIYWLLFQFVLLAGLDSFLEDNVKMFYQYQAPKSMRRYLGYFTKFVTGLGFMLSVLTVYVVGKVSERKGRQNWFQPTLNESRLDRYYWVLAVMGGANLLVFVVVAWLYRYEEPREDADGDGEGGDEGGGGPPDTGGDPNEKNCDNCCCCFG